MSTEETWGLKPGDCKLLAVQIFPGHALVGVLSILSNWGPPVGGRFDYDFLDIWAGVDPSVHATSVVLYGCDDSSGNWEVRGPFTKSESVSLPGRSIDLYHYNYRGIPPSEFVIRATNSGGSDYYDNNGGANYLSLS